MAGGGPGVRLPAELMLFALTVAVGITAGLGALDDAAGGWTLLLVPAIGAIGVAILVEGFAREAKGHGVPEVMRAVATQGGRIRPRVAVVKALASAITIGAGGSAGREGPIVQVGAALASTMGRITRQPPEMVTLMVAGGAAGGISATFNAPIAGVFFCAGGHPAPLQRPQLHAGGGQRRGGEHDCDWD